MYGCLSHGGQGWIHLAKDHQDKSQWVVMEYLGGPTLRDMAFHHYHTYGTTLPVSQVIAYGLEILRAFSYLHGTGLLYCDLKPSNVLQVHDQVKLIDLGGVRRQGDTKSPLIHTAGFAAPELDVRGATVASDLYSVGRTLGAFAARVDGSDEPEPATSPFHRVIEWAAHSDPDQRPRSADELAEHLTNALTAA